jgi:hypothetical protein
VATSERKMRDIIQKIQQFPQYNVKFQVIAADMGWNPSALHDALQSGLSEQIYDSFTNC